MFRKTTYKGSRFKILRLSCSIVSEFLHPQTCPTHLPNPERLVLYPFHRWLLLRTSKLASRIDLTRDQYFPVADHRTQQPMRFEGYDSQALNTYFDTSALEPKTALACRKIPIQFNAPVVTFCIYNTKVSRLKPRFTIQPSLYRGSRDVRQTQIE